MLKEAGRGLRALHRALSPAALCSHPSSHFGPGAALPAGWHCPAWLWMPDGVMVAVASCPGDMSLPSSCPPLPLTQPPCSLPTCPGHPCPSPPSLVAMPGTSLVPWVLLAQVPRGTLIFNFLSKPLTGESTPGMGVQQMPALIRGLGSRLLQDTGGSAGAPRPPLHPAAAQPCARGRQGISISRCAPLHGEEDERGSDAAQMEKLPRGHWLPRLGRVLTVGSPPSPWPWLTRLSS